MRTELDAPMRKLVRNFLIELVIYAILVTGYFLLALIYLKTPLANLFANDLAWYAVASLGLIVAQGVLLDLIVTFLADYLGWHRLK